MSRVPEKGSGASRVGSHESCDSLGSDASAHNHLFEQCRFFLKTEIFIIKQPSQGGSPRGHVVILRGFIFLKYMVN